MVALQASTAERLGTAAAAAGRQKLAAARLRKAIEESQCEAAGTRKRQVDLLEAARAAREQADAVEKECASLRRERSGLQASIAELAGKKAEVSLTS